MRALLYGYHNSLLHSQVVSQEPLILFDFSTRKYSQRTFTVSFLHCSSAYDIFTLDHELPMVFFVSAFIVISSVSAVDMFANLCLFMFLLGSVF